MYLDCAETLRAGDALAREQVQLLAAAPHRRNKVIASGNYSVGQIDDKNIYWLNSVASGAVVKLAKQDLRYGTESLLTLM
jgi:hypothetical protein